jgi:hypothetical protein
MVGTREEIKLQHFGVSRGRSEVMLALRGRLYQKDVVSKFEPKPGPRCRDSETHWSMSTQATTRPYLPHCSARCAIRLEE